MLIRTLAVAGSDADRGRIAAALAHADTLLAFARSDRELWRLLGRGSYDLVLLTRSGLPGLSPRDVAEIRELPDRPDVVVVSEPADPEQQAALQRAGCLAVVDPAVSDSSLRETLLAFVARRNQSAPTGTTPADPGCSSLESFVSASEAMQEFMIVARRIVRTDSTLLILGETGVGKEWLARAIHADGARGRGPFIAVNCAALSESLLESELFGHERGAFTGAARSRRGFFELAHGGTIFLDEIAELPVHLQSKLLRVLEERKIRAVGGERLIDIDVRVMAATNRDLEKEMRDGRFRRDLYYRLDVVSLLLPPLRERREDVPLLARRYIDHFNLTLGSDVRGITAEALRRLEQHAWPGNVRELINTIERACLLCASDVIRIEDLPHTLGGRAGAASSTGRALVRDEWGELPWTEVRRRVLEATEREYFAQLLERCGGRVGDAARRAGIDPRSLYEKLRRYGLRKEDFRSAGARPSAAIGAPIED